MRRLAIIDLGSNTARLVVLGYEIRKSYRLLDELREVVRLSEGMSEARMIRAEAFERGLRTLRAFRAYCDAVGISKICATATSAVRDAANGETFLVAVREETGLELRVLSGEEEAYFGTLAIANSTALEDALVLDLGGGSFQLSHMQKRRFVRGKSWPLGAVRSTESFFRADPPKKTMVKALQKVVRESIADWFKDVKGLPLVGMGGTLRNLATMAQKKEAYLVDLIHGYELSKRSLDAVVSDLLAKTTAERRLISGLNMDRADVIAAGGVVIREVLELSGQNAITVSGQGIREGLFYPYLFPEADHLAPEVRRFSVENLVRRYYDHPEHNQHVQQLSLMLFDQLADLHGYGSFERDLLRAAALLHDIGMAINYYDHHKHSFFLVMSMALPGFSHREQAIIALLVRYHRKGAPTDQGLGRLLEPLDMTRVTKLAALLRLAEYLERSKAQKVKTLQCHLAKGYLQIVLGAQGDAHVEVKEANLHSDLLAMAYGLKVEVVQTPH